METAQIAPSKTRKRGRPTKYHSGVDMLLEIYLESCEDVFDVPTRKWHVRLPTVDGFSDYLGVHRDTLYRWAKVHPDYGHVLDRIKRVQHTRLLNGGLSSHYSTSFAMFLLKVNHGYRMPKPIETYQKEKLIGVLRHLFRNEK